MGCSSGPDIIQDGLTFCVDAASVRSYPGTGTTWADIAGGVTGSFVNGASFDSNNAGSIDPISAAKIAKEYGIRVYTIGAGTKQSITQIPGRGFVRNEIDEETLEGIAQETNAKYFRAIDKNSLSSIYSEIDKLERSEITVNYFSSYKEIYIWFIVAGFILIMVSETLRTFYLRKIIWSLNT